jgi:hypothetical protein
VSSIDKLASQIRNALFVLGVPIVLEMAIYSGRNEVYSDLSRLSLGKIIPFAESFMLLRLGDNLSLTVEDSKLIVVSKISERAVLIVVTSQRIGTVLVKLKEVVGRYGTYLDELLLTQPVRTQIQAVPQPEEVAPASSAAVAEELAHLPPRQTPGIATFMAPVLLDRAALKNASGDDKKILSLCTGRFSIEDISKKTKMEAKIVIETIYQYSQRGSLELREEKKTGEEEAMDFLKRI